jgi:hypothetical protein
MSYDLFIGFYIGVAVPVFLFVGFFTCLGGKDEDLWKPFAYSVFWFPILVFWFLRKIFKQFS